MQTPWRLGWLCKDVCGHEFTVDTVHIDVVGLELFVQPRDADTMCAANVGHIWVLAGTANSAACVIVLEQL